MTWLRRNWPYLIVFVALGYTYWVDTQGDKERDVRADQICTIFERSHERDVRTLRTRYRYISQLGPREARSFLNQTVIAGVPDVEHDARASRAPDFCDESGLGLREPNPVIPPKRGFRHLLTPEGRRRLRAADGQGGGGPRARSPRPVEQSGPVPAAPPPRAAPPAPPPVAAPPPRTRPRPPRPAPQPPSGPRLPNPVAPQPTLLEQVCELLPALPPLPQVC